jgi:Zn-dependent protease with chaperone function
VDDTSDPLYPTRPAGVRAPRLPRAALVTSLITTLLALFAFVVALLAIVATSLAIAGYGGLVFVAGLAAWPSLTLDLDWQLLLFAISLPFAGLAMLTLGGGGVAVLVAHLFAPALEARSPVVLDLSEHPKLDQFLRRLAADVRAPMPARVLLAAEANAGIHRTSSTLLLGLGLINALDLAEFKAVVAHEYGHFSQSGSLLGNWAHRATYSLVQIVIARDRFDRWLVSQRSKGRPLISSFADLLITAVTQVRRLLAYLLEWVLTVHRSLGRQMELDADARAVREAGSDALVSGLWKAQRADLAFDQTLELAVLLGRQGHFVRDLFAVHQRRIAALQTSLEGVAHPMAIALAQPYQAGEALYFPSGPSMAADRFDSHPSLHERERAAKSPYIPGDPRPAVAASAWVLFDDAERLREQLTERTYAQLGEALGLVLSGERLDPDAFEERVRAEQAAVAWIGRRSGYYDDRFLVYGDFEALLGSLERGEVGLDEVAPHAASWRGPALAEFMDRYTRVCAELEQIGQARRYPGQNLDALLESRHVELRQLQAAFERGDRALFAWTWLQLAGPNQAQLVERTRLLLGLQGLIEELRPIGAELEQRALLVQQQGYARVAADLDALDEVALRARRQLAATLHRCTQAQVPAISTLSQPIELAALIGVELPEPAPEHDRFDRALALLEAIVQTRAQLSRVHDRMIGAILELHEQAERAA